MSDQPQTDTPENTPKDPVVIDWTAIINTNIGNLITAIQSHSVKTGAYTAWLLALVIACLTGLAWFALCNGHVDTAEKTIIAMVSFLGGAAIFNSDSTRK